MHAKPILSCCVWILLLATGLGGLSAGEARLERDIPYRNPEGLDAYALEKCRLDLYLPPDLEKGFATVVFLHAGGLTQGRKYVPGELRNRGFAVVSAGYRLHPQVKAPLYIEDAAAAVAWVFGHIEEYGGSPDRIVLVGVSAGGYLAGMVALDKRWLKPHGIDADRLAGLAMLSGQSITHFTVRKERGIPETRVVVDELAPMHHVRKEAPPMLLTSGDRELELLGRHEETAYFHRMLTLAGHPDVTFLELKGANHAGVEKASYPHLNEFIRRVLDMPESPSE